MGVKRLQSFVLKGLWDAIPCKPDVRNFFFLIKAPQLAFEQHSGISKQVNVIILHPVLNKYTSILVLLKMCAFGDKFGSSLGRTAVFDAPWTKLNKVNTECQIFTIQPTVWNFFILLHINKMPGRTKVKLKAL